MDSIRLPLTDRSPSVEFDYTAGLLQIRGESYPEDAAAFFGPLLQSLRAYLGDGGGDPVTLEVALVYFNSSSAKALMNLFMALEDAGAEGRPVTIRWFYAEGDDTIQEAGEDFASDFSHGTFELVKETRG